MVVYTFNTSIKEAKTGGFCEFKATLIYMVCLGQSRLHSETVLGKFSFLNVILITVSWDSSQYSHIVNKNTPFPSITGEGTPAQSSMADSLAGPRCVFPISYSQS